MPSYILYWIEREFCYKGELSKLLVTSCMCLGGWITDLASREAFLVVRQCHGKPTHCWANAIRIRNVSNNGCAAVPPRSQFEHTDRTGSSKSLGPSKWYNGGRLTNSFRRWSSSILIRSSVSSVRSFRCSNLDIRKSICKHKTFRCRVLAMGSYPKLVHLLYRC